MNKPKVGDKLFLVKPNRYREPRTTPCIVTKVGSKFFYIDALKGTQFYIDTWRDKTIYGTPDYQLYPTEQDYLDEKESEQWGQSFMRRFQHGHVSDFTLNQLREAGKILGIKIGE